MTSGYHADGDSDTLRPVPNGVRCESKIESVTVYARGASVKRRAALTTELPDEACSLLLPGLTGLADPGTLRASIDGSREVLGVFAELVVPDRKHDTGSLTEKIRELRRKRDDLVTEQSHAVWRRELCASIHPEPDLVRRVAVIDPAERTLDALSIVGLIGEEMSALDAKIAEFTAAIEVIDRETEKLRVELAQASASEKKGDAPPELCAVVRLGPKKEGDAPAWIEVEYAVLAARWWPSYRARFTDGASKVSLGLSALVAQASGEDWTAVRLHLSTGDLLRDVRLPEVTSMRLGRAQRPRARGYRPPPEGLDTMFDGFDRFVAQVSVTSIVTTTMTVSATTAAPAGPATWQGETPVARAIDEGGVGYLGHADDLDEPTAVAAMRDLTAKAKIETKTRMGKTGALLQSAPGFGGGGGPEQAPPALPAASAAPARNAPAMKPEAQAAPRGGAHLERKKSRLSLSLAEAPEADAETLGGLVDDELLPIEPADAWLDFDALRIDPTAHRTRRGRLTREAGPSAALAVAAAERIERMETPAGAIDPRASRGLFDVVYTASGTADVPSSGRPCRVTVLTADAAATPRFVTVPREAAEVYRKADVANPFGLPLLTGPVEVLIDGALVALTRLSYTDRGGVISIGLGVEERVRVARNTRIEEGTAGLLGGSTTVDHTITTELSSALGRKITVEVIDRIPVSDDKDVEIKLLASSPQPSPYTQADLGQPVRKGLRWDVEVAPGGKAKIEHRYRITLPSKMEIVGGNRRE